MHTEPELPKRWRDICDIISKLSDFGDCITRGGSAKLILSNALSRYFPDFPSQLLLRIAEEVNRRVVALGLGKPDEKVDLELDLCESMLAARINRLTAELQDWARRPTVWHPSDSPSESAGMDPRRDRMDRLSARLRTFERRYNDRSNLERPFWSNLRARLYERKYRIPRESQSAQLHWVADEERQYLETALRRLTKVWVTQLRPRLADRLETRDHDAKPVPLALARLQEILPHCSPRVTHWHP